ncbi:uncharacterized protein LOC106082058 [Stomoxys calcitrans]|uniref:MADF domain-containing protein n=1 Tax=Stomoxys calcitrans TaxID=35570 RepID=A0A1I8PJ71_STOCA|nr:uncharacterized protein LOC106082058 [Stomoxys calcitrans]
MEFQLIEFVKENPILYDKKYRSMTYKDQKVRKWNEIARKLRKDPNAVRLKWKSLRDTFKKRLQRKADECEDITPSKTWKYNEHLQFLKDQYPEPEEFKMEEVEILQEELEEQIQEEMQELQEEDEDQFQSNEPDFEVENFNLNEYLKKFDISNNAGNATSTEEQPKKKRLDKDSIISEASHEMAILLECAKQHFTPPSATQIFFNSMALQVEEAKLPPIELMRLQQRVLEAVTQEIVMCQDGQNGATYVIQM